MLGKCRHLLLKTFRVENTLGAFAEMLSLCEAPPFEGGLASALAEDGGLSHLAL